MAIEESEEISSPGSSTPSTTGRTFGCTGIFSKVGAVDEQVVDPRRPQSLEEVVGRPIPGRAPT